VQDIDFMPAYSTVEIMEFSEFATQKLLEAAGQSEHLTDREKL
jgi:hypothetical protein